jgi:cell wall-associated NlpC family hydrolase
MRNAGIIYSVGRQMGLGTRDIQIALIAAMVESNLVNVNYGDRDSLGLFQQRPSQGWGTPEQVTDPYYAARKFFSALKGLGPRRLQMGMGEAAQAVQRSAYPSRYAERIGEMRGLWPSISEAGGDVPLTVEGAPFPTQQLDQIPVDQMVEEETTAALMLGAPDDSMAGAAGADLTAPTNTALGAWGMVPQLPEEDPLDSGATTPLSEGTRSVTVQNFAPLGTQGVDGWRKAVVSAARSAIGTPYVWGGNSLQSGVDCSGLIQQAFARAGMDIPRVSYQQANFGQRVGLKGIQPGDLVAWDNSSRNNGADHIAIYLGNGMIIESPRPGLSVRVRKLGGNEGAWGVQMPF